MLLRRIGRECIRLTQQTQFGILQHHKMQLLKQNMQKKKSQRTFMMKIKFIWKETKYTLAQGFRDLWSDTKWIINLYKTKESIEFTGYEMAESHRIKLDLLKFVPYSILLAIPFAELAIPVILWLFPNAIPSFFLFDNAWDKRIQEYEHKQDESHRVLIDKLTDVMIDLNIEPNEFSRYEFFKQSFFEVIDELDKHLNYNNFNSDELLHVLQFLGGGDFFSGTYVINKIVNLFTMSIPRTVYKMCRWIYYKITRREIPPYEDPWFVRGNFKIFRFNYYPFEFIKRRFLLMQIRRKFKMLWYQDRAFQKYGMDDILGNDIKQFARERGLATLSCYDTLKNVIKYDYVKFTTNPKFKNTNTKLWYSVMMYNFLKESSRDIN